MSHDPRAEDFVVRLTGCQSALFAYIFSLLPDPEAARDVLQETVLVLWRKADEASQAESFYAWAREVARLKVLSYLRDQKRDRHLFDAAYVESLADRSMAPSGNESDLAAYLDECLQMRTQQERDLLRERYALGGSVNEMAKQRGLSPNKLSVTLCRLRHKLWDCVQRKLAAAGGG